REDQSIDDPLTEEIVVERVDDIVEILHVLSPRRACCTISPLRWVGSLAAIVAGVIQNPAAVRPYGVQRTLGAEIHSASGGPYSLFLTVVSAAPHASKDYVIRRWRCICTAQATGEQPPMDEPDAAISGFPLPHAHMSMSESNHASCSVCLQRAYEPAFMSGELILRTMCGRKRRSQEARERGARSFDLRCCKIHVTTNPPTMMATTTPRTVKTLPAVPMVPMPCEMR